MKNYLWKAALTLSVLLAVATGCGNDSSWKQKASDAAVLHAGIERLVEIIKFDIFSPPVASRIFAYSTIAAYEAMAAGDPGYQSLAGQLNGLDPAPQPEAATGPAAAARQVGFYERLVELG